MPAIAETQTLPEATDYAAQLYHRVRSAWLRMLERRAPNVARQVLQGAVDWPEADYADHLQAATIWFHLQQIMDENIAVHDARQIERHGTFSDVPDSFAQVLSEPDPEARNALHRLVQQGGFPLGQPSPPTRPRPSASRLWKFTGAFTVNLCSSKPTAGHRKNPRAWTANWKWKLTCCG